MQMSAYDIISFEPDSDDLNTVKAEDIYCLVHLYTGFKRALQASC